MQRDAWRALQAQCPDLTPFQTWEWNEAWWRHFGARKRLVLLLFWVENRLVGLAPLYASWHLGTPLRRLAWVGTGQSDYLGPLVLPEYAEAVSEALYRILGDGLRGWDMADLQQLRPDNSLFSRAARPWPQHPAEFQSLLPMEPCPYLALPDTWEKLTATLGKKMRSNLGYYERLLYRTFADAEVSLADNSTLEEGMTALFALHQSRWNARWLPGVLGNKRVQAFHREVAARFLEQGWLRLHLLRAEGELRAALYCFASGNRTFYYLGGFAPEYSKYSLGTLLTGRAIQQAIAEAHSEFDFLRGSESYKYRWQPEERINHRILLLRPRRGLGELPGRAGFALNRMERYVEHRVKAFAEQQGRKQKESEAGSHGAKTQGNE
jgi:CelD/BcsL family acetyltransferase involved in cellulose biosynthesis